MKENPNQTADGRPNSITERPCQQGTPNLDRKEFTIETNLSTDHVKAAVDTGSPELLLDIGGGEIALEIFQQFEDRVGKSRVDVPEYCSIEWVCRLKTYDGHTLL